MVVVLSRYFYGFRKSFAERITKIASFYTHHLSFLTLPGCCYLCHCRNHALKFFHEREEALFDGV